MRSVWVLDDGETRSNAENVMFDAETETEAKKSNTVVLLLQ